MDKELLISIVSFGVGISLIGAGFNNTRPNTLQTSTAIPTLSPVTNITPETSPQITTLVNDAGKEIVDPPLHRDPLSYTISAKTIKFTIASKDESIITRVSLDPLTFDYKAETNYENGFYYTHANGSVCFSKPSFKNIYCLREKYTPAALARYLTGDTSLKPRELNSDEEGISGLMNELGWVPNNALAGFMSEVELSINLLRQQKLKKDSVLKTTYDGKMSEIGTIEDVQFLENQEDIKTQGVNLATVLALIYNKQGGNIENLELPLINFESAKTDDNFEDISKDYDIDIHKYLLVQ